MNTLPSLDTHTHFDPARPAEELAQAGAALAMTLSLQEASEVLGRQEALIAWGVGCHPREPNALGTFNAARFSQLAARSAVIGEIGLDTTARTPLPIQLHVLRQVLEILSSLPRLVSIHSYLATGLVLEELRKKPVSSVILHWWTGSEAETKQAVEMGCYFSIHPSIARHAKFRTCVPLERLLFESDQGWEDAPASIPLRIAQAEERLARQWDISAHDLRLQAWKNFAALVRQTGTQSLLPAALVKIMQS